MAMAVLYLLIGSGVLIFQDTLKPYFFSYGVEYTKIYPLNAIVQLLLAGLPCTVLAAVNLAGSQKDNRTFPVLAAIYCSTVLIAHSLVIDLISTSETALNATMKGVEYVANLSAVNAMFHWTRIFADAALVLLLISCILHIKESDKTV